MGFTDEQLAAETAKQRAAAHSAQLQVRVVAGPGTGKSTTIEERVRWLLERGVMPRAIAVVSFTRASVRDLQLRIQAHCAGFSQEQAVDIQVVTLHSLALGVLSAGNQLVYYPAKPLVMDDWELENIYDTEFGIAHGIGSKPRREEIRRFYEALWSTGEEDADTYTRPKQAITLEDRTAFEAFHGPTAQVYSCVLPGEIVRKCVDATRAGTLHPAALLRIEHLIVDEYQDLNPADIEFIDDLANEGVNIFVVGDDDQSIYGFRHASPSGIQRFPVRFPHAGLPAPLDGCFRCTSSVLDAATSLMRQNSGSDRIEKALTSLYVNSDPPNAGIVHRWVFTDATTEARAIANSCTALIREGLEPNNILILLSTRDGRTQLWPPLKEALEGNGLPFESPKEEGFIDTASGRLVLALVRIVCSRSNDGQPQDFVAHRVLLGSKRGVGAGTCNQIRQAVLRTPNTSFRDLFYGPELTLQVGTLELKGLNHSRTVCQAISGWVPDDTIDQRDEDIARLVEQTIDSAAAEAWRAYGQELIRDMNLKELRDYLWADNDEHRSNVLKALNTRIGAAVEDLPILPAKIQVMTMHGAKGLSSKIVFVPGLEEGLLPNQRQIPFAAKVLEAARLLYVSITRARSCCILSYATNRRVAGTYERTPSRFAAQTGGRFVQRAAGLTNQEASALRDSVGSL